MEFTLAQFIATRRHVQNVASFCEGFADLDGFATPGYVYASDMPITITRDANGDERLGLLLGLETFDAPHDAKNLETMERRLYLFYIWECTILSHLIERGALCDDLDEDLKPLFALIGQDDAAPAAMFFSAPGRTADDWRTMNAEQRATLLTGYVDADVTTMVPKTDKSDATRIAKHFSELLQSEIGIKGIEEASRLNKAELMPGACHSHDFCDSNVLMNQAFIEVTGRQPETAQDFTLWLVAWDIAIAKSFNFVVRSVIDWTVITPAAATAAENHEAGYRAYADEKTRNRAREHYKGALLDMPGDWFDGFQDAEDDARQGNPPMYQPKGA